MKWSVLFWIVALSGCGASAKAVQSPVATLRPLCSPTTYWDGTRCTERQPDAARDLAAGVEALAGFRVEEALTLLQRARDGGPHQRDQYVRVYEQIGIAQAYLGAEQPALDAFDMLLSLAPGHLLSYTLSPKATFVFERARTRSQQQPRPTLDVSWPRDLDVDDPVPIEVEVVADPKSFLKRAELRVRRRGSDRFDAVDLQLSQEGYQRVVIPALNTGKPEVLELYVSAFDDRGNEVFQWAGPERPREIPLDYRPPVAWYRNWWVWATIGGVVAASTGTIVYVVSRDPPDTIDGRLELP